MTARQQIARLLPLVLLVVLVIAGLRGVVPAPRWNGPLQGPTASRSASRLRSSSARCCSWSAGTRPPGGRPVRALQPAPAERTSSRRRRCGSRSRTCSARAWSASRWSCSRNCTCTSSAGRGRCRRRPRSRAGAVPPTGPGGGGGRLHIPLGPILYALLVIAIVAAVVVSIWWSTRLRRPAAPLVIEDVSTEELARRWPRAGPRWPEIDDARAAIIACYVAMERRLAERGTARAAADTPDELLARAVASGAVRGGAAGRLTALFYEARFSTHPLGAGQRDAASAALDELAAELAGQPAGQAAGSQAQAAARRAGRQASQAAGAAGEQPPGRAAAGHELAPRAPRAGHRRDHGRRRRPGRRRRVGLAGRGRGRRRDRRPRPAAAARPRPQVGRAGRCGGKQDKQRARAISRLRAAPVRRGHQPDQPRRCTSRTCGPSLSTSSPPGWRRSHARQPLHRAGRGPAGVLPHPGATSPCGPGSTRRRPSTPTSARASSNGIPRRTLARLITRLEQL